VITGLAGPRNIGAQRTRTEACFLSSKVVRAADVERSADKRVLSRLARAKKQGRPYHRDNRSHRSLCCETRASRSWLGPVSRDAGTTATRRDAGRSAWAFGIW